jgi:DME family drug/metabolite transporter
MSETMIGEIAALGAALCWALSAVLYKEALLKAKPFSANLVRLTSTSVILFLCLAAIGKLEVLTKLPIYSLFLACLSGIIGLGFGDILYMRSLKLMGVARTVPITCTYPLFSLLFAAFIGRENITFPLVLGTVIIVLGVWLISQREKTDNDEGKRKNLVRGVAGALATSILWSISIMMMDAAVKLPATASIYDAFAVNAVRVMAIAFYLLVSAPIMDRELSFLKMRGRTLASIILGGVVALALGWFFLAFSFLELPQSRAVPISSTTPLFSTLLGVLLLRERFTAKNAVGSIIIVLGVFLIFTF